MYFLNSQFQKMKIIAIFLLMSNIIFSQDYRFGDGEDLIFFGHSYKTIVFSKRVDGDVYRTQWLTEDLVIRESSGILDIKTQQGLLQNGYFVNGTSDSIYINVLGALKLCPVEWRVPRIGEWDTLLSTISMDQRKYMFKYLPGYIGQNSSIVNDSIVINRVEVSGGFWWSSTYNEHWVYGIELDYQRNLYFGKAPLWDKASVRCVRDL